MSLGEKPDITFFCALQYFTTSAKRDWLGVAHMRFQFPIFKYCSTGALFFIIRAIQVFTERRRIVSWRRIEVFDMPLRLKGGSSSAKTASSICPSEFALINGIAITRK